LPNSKNMMGKMLMELREEFKSQKKLLPVNADVDGGEGGDLDNVILKVFHYFL